jgi:enoyl-CoA hydratase
LAARDCEWSSNKKLFMSYQYILTDISEKIAVVSINNPPMNCLSGELLISLDSTIRELNENRKVKVIIITGEGRLFATGADIAEMGRCATAEEAKRMSQLGQQVLLNIENSSKPVIAAINGFCLGGGLELALSCHIRIASEKAVFGMPEIYLGMIPAFGGSYRLTRISGSSRALQMILTGDKIKSGEALAIGLVNMLFPGETLMEEAKKLAGRMTGKSSASMRLVLKSILEGSCRNIDEAMEIESAGVAELYNMHDLVEGVHAFLEKRKPDFTDF